MPWNRKKSDFPIVRIDDRLLHGQVVVGWAGALGLEWLILVNDRVSENKGLSAAIKAGVPPEIRADVVTFDQAVNDMIAGEYAQKKSMLVLESPGDALRLLHKGVALRKLHVGGLHFREGSEELLPYVFLSNWDRMALDEMLERGVRITCQDIPSTTPVAYRG
ncbi:MAG: PTS sugar transporter subunit IIB [Calditrichaeota bacterium]|nr:PTS sugar transporter subunit IIB [Calditrichota bacterium]MCB9367796.1 PTS sugar transporter subunit IIB [Calditrichota bacterium]